MDDQTILRRARDEILDALESMVHQHCGDTEDGAIDSLALSANAEAMHVLAKYGRLDIEVECGRRVIARWRDGGRA